MSYNHSKSTEKIGGPPLNKCNSKSFYNAVNDIKINDKMKNQYTIGNANNNNTNVAFANPNANPAPANIPSNNATNLNGILSQNQFQNANKINVQF